MTTYTHGHDESVLRSHRWRTAANSAAYLLPHLRAGQSVLDVGCGPGTITADLARAVAPGTVVGLDVVAAPLAEARATAAGASFAVGDVHALPYANGTFDVVHAHQVLQHLQDPVGALREMTRVTKPGGLVAVRDADYEAMTWWPALPALDRWLDAYRATCRGNRAEPDAGRRLLSWVLEAGLTPTASASVWCFADPDDRAWWGGSWARRALDSDFAVQVVEQGHLTRADLEEVSAAFVQWAEAPDAWWVIVHGEVLCRA
jgi:SAM-dependent methyltransferase